MAKAYCEVGEFQFDFDFVVPEQAVVFCRMIDTIYELADEYGFRLPFELHPWFDCDDNEIPHLRKYYSEKSEK